MNANAIQKAVTNCKAVNANSINWSQFNAVNKRTGNGLCLGEIKTLTEEEIAEVNRVLGEMEKLSVALYNHLEIARARFRFGQVEEKKPRSIH